MKSSGDNWTQPPTPPNSCLANPSCRVLRPAKRIYRNLDLPAAVFLLPPL